MTDDNVALEDSPALGEIKALFPLLDYDQIAEAIPIGWQIIEEWEAEMNIPVGGIRKQLIGAE